MNEFIDEIRQRSAERMEELLSTPVFAGPRPNDEKGLELSDFGKALKADVMAATALARTESTDPAVIGPLAAEVLVQIRYQRWVEKARGT